MSGLTWLHLSDWHQRDVRFDPKVVRDKLVEDIEGRTAISPVLAKIDFIVFSGDVASAGKPDEYEAAKKEFFDYLLEASEVSPRRLFIVPGNHDLDGNILESIPDEFKRDSVSKEDVDLWLEDIQSREQLLKPFKEFKNFVANYTGQDSPEYANVRTLKIDGKKIAIVGINSAWWCRRHKNAEGKLDDYGFVLVGESQIHRPIGQISDADLKIVVLHHAQDWLAPFDGNKIWNRLKHSCDFILHGHGHTPKVTAEHGTDGDCVIIPAGASFNRRIAKDSQYANS
jgi:3',5'-cyclic AMP phosphodiesterase CpdA